MKNVKGNWYHLDWDWRLKKNIELNALPVYDDDDIYIYIYIYIYKQK